MSKKVSMATIAKQLGLSKNTVSLALRGMPGISDETRRLVFAAAENMNYRYAHTKSMPSVNICLIMPKAARDSVGFFSLVQFGLEDEARKNSMNTILHFYEEGTEKFETPRCIEEGIVSAIVTLGRISEATIKAIDSYGLPVVMIDHYYDNLNTDCILTDNRSSCFTATEYLIEKGHSHIGFFGNITSSISFYDRYAGYGKALEKHGLSFKEPFCVLDMNMDELERGNAAAAEAVLRSMEKLPTAFVCCNDAEAIVLYKILRRMGVAVPDDISVIGFDDIEASGHITPELTTMRVHKQLMGRKAIARLLSLQPVPGALPAGRGGQRQLQRQFPEKLLLPAELVERKSVRDFGENQRGLY